MPRDSNGDCACEWADLSASVFSSGEFIGGRRFGTPMCGTCHGFVQASHRSRGGEAPKPVAAPTPPPIKAFSAPFVVGTQLIWLAGVAYEVTLARSTSGASQRLEQQGKMPDTKVPGEITPAEDPVVVGHAMTAELRDTKDRLQQLSMRFSSLRGDLQAAARALYVFAFTPRRDPPVALPKMREDTVAVARAIAVGGRVLDLDE